MDANRSKRRFLPGVLAMTGLAAQDPGEAAWRARFQEAFTAAFADASPSIAAAVLVGDRVLISRTVGSVRGSPLDDRTVLDADGMASEFTAVAALRLAADRMLALDAGIGDYLPQVPASWRDLTARRLLDRRSGLPPEPEIAFDDRMDRPRFLAALLRNDPAATAGRVQVDADADWQVLACLMEAAAAAPFADVMREHLFEPAGMLGAEVSARTYRERGVAGVRCSLADLIAYVKAFEQRRLVTAAAESLLYADAAATLCPLGLVQRDRAGSVIGYERTHGRVWLLRRPGLRLCIVAVGGEDGAVQALAAAFAERMDPSTRSQAPDGRYRLDARNWFDVVSAGAGIELRAVGTEATARLLHGLPVHPEWPNMLRDYEDNAQLLLKPLLKRDAASAARAFDARAPAGAAERAQALIENLVARHGPPRDVAIVGTRMLGSVHTTARVTFGTTPIGLRLQWFGQKLAEVTREDTEHPTRLAFALRGESYEASSLDGKARLTVTFRRQKARAVALVFTDASREGKAGILCRRQ